MQFAAFVPHDGVVVGANDGTRDRLFALAADGAPRALPLGDVDVRGARDGGARRRARVRRRHRPRTEPSSTCCVPARPAPRRLTHYNDAIAARALGRTRTIAWRSADGFTADGVLTEPVNPVRGRRYPLVVLIHGGPTATSREGFSALAQLMAARGWYVFQPNYRGSDNLGRRLALATVPHITSAPGRDVLDGVDAVLKLGVVDPPASASRAGAKAGCSRRG